MTEERYEELKKTYLDNIQRFLTDTGGLFPHITLFGTHNDKPDLNAIIHIPIPDEFLADEGTKDVFIDKVVPELAKEIKTKFTTEGVAWASEAWMRTIDKDQAKDPSVLENWKDLPIKKEVLFVTMESSFKNESLVMEIVRNGKQVTESGDLIDHVELKEMPEMSTPDQAMGRLTGLYKKFCS